MANVVAVRKRPGLYFNPSTGKYFSIVEYYDGEKYDTIAQASGAISAGTNVTWFNNLTNKDLNSCNFLTARRINKGEEMLVKRMSVSVPLAFGNTVPVVADIKKVLYGLYCVFRINRLDVAEGLAIEFPSGYGMAGQTNENNAGVVSNGVASTAAQRQLEKIHEITSEHDLEGKGTFFDVLWDATNMATTAGKCHVRASFGGLIRRAATK